MSLLRRIGRVVGRVARVLPGPVGAAARTIATVGGAVGAARATVRGARTPTTMSAMPGGIGGALPALPSLPGAGPAARAGAVIAGGRALMRNPTVQRWSRRAARAAGYAVAGSLIYDAAGNIIGQAKSRRMNPLNHRALKRAIRRVKSAKKICNEVEKIAGGRRRSSPAFVGRRGRSSASCSTH